MPGVINFRVHENVSKHVPPPDDFVDSVSASLTEMGIPPAYARQLIRSGEFLEDVGFVAGEHSWEINVPIFGEHSDITMLIGLFDFQVKMLKDAKHPDVKGIE